MTAPDAVTMDDDERDSFLGDGGTGVLSLAPTDGAGEREAAPHAVPVSYGYDAAEGTFYFRLAAGADSDKGELAGRPATFVTYGQREGVWHSVVASGRLEPTDDAAIGTDGLAGLERVHIPLVDVFGQPPSEVSFEFHRLVPSSLTARRESSTAP
jgi:hypothetical protein